VIGRSHPRSWITSPRTSDVVAAAAIHPKHRRRPRHGHNRSPKPLKSSLGPRNNLTTRHSRSSPRNPPSGGHCDGPSTRLGDPTLLDDQHQITMITTLVAIASRPDGSRTRPHRGACHPVLSPLAFRRCEGTRDESPFTDEFTDWCSVQTRDRSPRAARSTRISSKCRKRRGRHLQPPPPAVAPIPGAPSVPPGTNRAGRLRRADPPP